MLDEAILRTLAYADVFDYPRTAKEIHRYLIGMLAEETDVQSSLKDRLEPGRQVEQRGAFFTLAGRGELVARRIERENQARLLWPEAVRYGRMIASLPYVRMSAVTGALAVNNVEKGADIDYLVVTRPDRLWICRAAVIAVVRMAASRGITLCPNYIVSEEALAFPNPSLYAAHELAQMKLISGKPVWGKMQAQNTWVKGFLPNAEAGTAADGAMEDLKETNLKSWSENFLRLPLFERIEVWEMDRKIRKFGSQRSSAVEAGFGRNWCKGHFSGHANRTMSKYRERLQMLGLSAARLE